MSNATLLHILVAVHTLIAAASTGSLFYLYYAAFRGHHPARDPILVFALAWPLVNLILLALNGMVCPMQDWAQALVGRHDEWVRDIYWIPESWLRLVPWTYGPSYLIGAALVFGRLWFKKRASPSAPAPPPRRASP